MDRIQAKNPLQKLNFYSGFLSYCGEGGIRTRETLLAFTHFPGVPLQPLEHLSLVGAS